MQGPHFRIKQSAKDDQFYVALVSGNHETVQASEGLQSLNYALSVPQLTVNLTTQIAGRAALGGYVVDFVARDGSTVTLPLCQRADHFEHARQLIKDMQKRSET